MSDQSLAQPGTCPRCGAPVLYARIVGLLTVVNAIPVPPADEWRPVSEGVATYSVVAGRLKLRTAAYRRHAPAATAHPVHTGCGPAVPRPAAVEPPLKRAEAFEPPFDPTHCGECRGAFLEGEEHVGYFYAPSQWWAAHAYDCTASREKVAYKRRPPKVPRSKTR